MAVDVIMPQMGESVAEGTIVRWLKAVGDSVDRDEPIFEITTDKVDAEIPAPEAGVLLEIKVGEGETVEVGSVVAIIGSADEKPSGGGAKKPAAEAKADEPAAPAAAAPAADVGDTDRADMSAADLRRTRSTPVVRKIAEEHGIDDLSAIDGSGLDGRVTKKDILAYIESGAHEEAPAKAEAPKAPAKATAPSAGRVELGIPKIPVNARAADTVEKMTGIRKATSDNMILSKQYSAHVHTCFEIDYTRIDRLRRKFKAQYAERGGKLTFTTFLAKATIDALKAFPIVNAAHDGDNVVYRGNINLGIAVALDRGLLVPVIGDADDLSMLGLSKRIADLGERARGKKLMPQELDGLTFSITNPGIFGSQWGTPVIPQPTTAILGVGTIEKRVKVHTLPDGTDTMVIRTCGYVTLGFDHRTIDGAVADAFVGHLKQTLEGFDESAM